ncbi:hypothetical protein [Brevundimonas sp.]|uniref:hypothetical protein n=1 Tax=Brevundimonas sp. TaxID=1871086 RepID=UPI002B608879|nr:hypothetical protein [Brevundimonas sp.]HWQ85760.1 hypothetical protein [Brevundimonas sp.]
MDEDTLRSRAECWRRRAAEALDTRERDASAKLADHYEAMLACLERRRTGPAQAAPDAGGYSRE